MTTEHLQRWALYLAGMGWHVFPLVPGTQRPALRDWEQRATTEVDRITRCWHGAGRAFNIGLATGPSQLVVVDLDPAKAPGEPDGATALTALAQDRGVELPATYTVTTPRGGTHLYFQTPPGVRLRNTAGTLAPHVDTRASGGYVVGPGSTRPDGGYELTDDTDPTELPTWLVQALSQRPAAAPSAPAQTPATNPTAYVAAAVEGECQRVRHAPQGQHNATLCRAAYALGQLVGAGLLDHTTAHTELTTAAQTLTRADCNCTPTEVARVITTGLAAGARNPRRTTRNRTAA
ncbi:MAG: bifunctional DNA primase/polymerase [Pseudonocardiaceae bacterium]